MTRPVAWLQPGPPDTLTGGFIYNRRIMASMGGAVTLTTVGSGFPFPSETERQDAAEQMARIADDTTMVIDGLALGVLANEAGREADRLRLIGLVHHPLALETGLSDQQRRSFADSERRALAHVRRVIVTSRSTAAGLADYDVPDAKIDIVEPGTDPAPLAARTGGPPIRLLAIATLTPRKGHAVLIAALARLTDLDWVLACYGSLDRDPDCTSAVRREIDGSGLSDRVTLHGERDQGELAAAYDNAHVLVQPSFHEGYGMALSEALARGLPIVSTTAGAIPDTVPSDAGLLVPPGDSEALATALRAVITDTAIRNGLAKGAARARTALPTWQAQASRFSDILNRIP